MSQLQLLQVVRAGGSSWMGRYCRILRSSPRRWLQMSLVRSNDSFCSSMTSRRVKIPYIQALREEAEKKNIKQDEEKNPTEDKSGIKRTMSDSYVRWAVQVIPFAEDPWLLDDYLNADGHIRLGALFMDLDALAGAVAYKHTGDTPMIVTAAVDRVTIRNPLKQICNLELSGQVTYASGRSSLEVTLQVAKSSTGNNAQDLLMDNVVMNCVFTMVCLDPVSKTPVNTYPLAVSTERERLMYENGEKNYLARKLRATRALHKAAPNAEESALIHSMWLQHRHRHVPNTKSNDVIEIAMEKTTQRSTQIMQPQYRNRHNFMIFGGFLLRQAFELAFCCAAAFSTYAPTFISLDPSTFENPVPVGSALVLKAVVAYTSPVSKTSSAAAAAAEECRSSEKHYTQIQIRVDSWVRDIQGKHTEAKPTGQFNYTFLVENDKALRVIPKSYAEFIVYLDARRRAERVHNLIQTAALTGGEKVDEGKQHRVME